MSNTSSDWYERLTPAERVVLEAYAEHHSYQAVAIALGKSESVVDQQLLTARRKMDVVSTAEAMFKLAERKAYLATIEETSITGVQAPQENESKTGPVPTTSSVEAAQRQASFTPDPEGSGPGFEPPGGAMLLNSPFYVKRHADDLIHSAIDRRDGIIRVRGSRQIGKTSLIARGLNDARRANARVIVTDIQRLSAADTESVETFYFGLARRIASQLKTTGTVTEYWDAPGSAVEKFDEFFESEVLRSSTVPIVWAIDEADSLFAHDYSEEVFSHIRARFNARALDGDALWQKLTQILTYSTEAHLLIKDLKRSPFNVGTAVELQDFSLEQVSDLNNRYGKPLATRSDVERLYELVGGHPFLVRHCLYELTVRDLGMSFFDDVAAGDFEFFADHLDRMRIAISDDPALASTVRGLLQNQSGLDVDCLRRLHSAGVLIGPTNDHARVRCQLYEMFLTSLVT